MKPHQEKQQRRRMLDSVERFDIDDDFSPLEPGAVAVAAPKRQTRAHNDAAHSAALESGVVVAKRQTRARDTRPGSHGKQRRRRTKFDERATRTSVTVDGVPPALRPGVVAVAPNDQTRVDVTEGSGDLEAEVSKGSSENETNVQNDGVLLEARVVRDDQEDLATRLQDIERQLQQRQQMDQQAPVYVAEVIPKEETQQQQPLADETKSRWKWWLGIALVVIVVGAIGAGIGAAVSGGANNPANPTPSPTSNGTPSPNLDTTPSPSMNVGGRPSLVADPTPTPPTPTPPTPTPPTPTPPTPTPPTASTALPTADPLFFPTANITSLFPTANITSLFPTADPSLFPTADPARFQVLRELLTAVSGDSLLNESSDQFRALEWLARDDTAALPTDFTPELVERYVLALLYFATGGENWNNPSRFLSNDVICQWHSGIICNNEISRVTSIELGQTNLQGSIPGELAALDNVEILGFGGNLLTGILPTELGRLSGLRELDFSGNSLTGTLPTELGNLADIVVLNLAFTRIEGTIPSGYQSLSPTLQRVWLHDTNIIGNLSSVFCTSGNNISEFIADCLDNVTCSCCTECFLRVNRTLGRLVPNL